MSRMSALLSRKTCASAVALLALIATGARNAHAQINFSTSDWVTDRGARLFGGTAGTQNPDPTRLGGNNYNVTGNNPGNAIPRFTFPLTRDLYAFGNQAGVNPARPIASLIDNPNPADPFQPPFITVNGNRRYLPYQPVNNGIVDTVGDRENTPGYGAATNVNSTPGFREATAALQTVRAPRAQFLNGTTLSWNLTNLNNPAIGFSRRSEAQLAYNFDYDYVAATHDDFSIPRQNASTPITTTEAASFPYAEPYIYRAVHQRLIALQGQVPIAQWSSGKLANGRYSVELYSPGDGTLLPNAANTDFDAYPTAQRVFVRVSWRGTVNNATGAFIAGSGVANAGGYNDPANSRIFLVDLSARGWTQLTGQTGAVAFPYDGDDANQVVVTLYAATPDSLTNSVYVRPPLVTADAVRFSTVLLDSVVGVSGPQGLGPIGTRGGTISAAGRILASAVSSSNVVSGPNISNPLFYLAREEYVPDPTTRISDPTDSGSTLIQDPISLVTVPVFYCVDSTNGNADRPNVTGTLINSADKVRWRYVGAPIRNNANGAVGTPQQGTSVASPTFGNIRRRDGSVVPMVFFATTTDTGQTGRIYAFDPVGDTTNRLTDPNWTGTTTLYWAYPSIRPLLGTEAAGTPNEIYDPNYNGAVADPNYPPFTSLTTDQDVATGLLTGVRYADGDIFAVAGFAPQVDARSQVRLPGMLGSPTVVDDPDNVTGPQLLIAPTLNGTVFALDAGGRGDFAPNTTAFSGTTQRIWTWPTLRADYLRQVPRTRWSDADIPGVSSTTASPFVSFPSTPSIDLSAPAPRPMLLGGGDGRVHAIALRHDVYPVVVAGALRTTEQRRLWQYPAVGALPLPAPPSTIAVNNFSTGSPLYHFTSGGRVYALTSTQLAVANQINTVQLGWVYPYTPTVPNAVATDDNTLDISPGFLGNAPLVQRVTYTDNSVHDLVTVVSSIGEIYTLSAPSVTPGQTQLLATAQTGGSNVSSSPTITLINSQSDLTLSNRPALLVSDSSGAASAYGLEPFTQTDANGVSTTYHPLLWTEYGQGARSASVILSNAYLGVGDERGVFYGYSDGPRGGTTLGPSPDIRPLDVPRAGVNDGKVTIDLRSVDYYDQAGINQLISGAKTPGVSEAGAPLANYLDPAPGILGTRSRAYEIGDNILVAAWGVYHALPQADPNLAARGVAGTAGIPNITVTFQIDGVTSIAQASALPPTGAYNYGNAFVSGWPVDPAVTLAEADQLRIKGKLYVDPMTSSDQEFKGRAEGAYPWVAYTVFPRSALQVKPDANNLFSPGRPYYVKASVTLTQQIEIESSTMPGTYGGSQTVTWTSPGIVNTPASTPTNYLFAGQRDAVGKSINIDANRQGLDTERRAFFVANPIAVSIKGNPGGGAAPGEGLISWFPNVSATGRTAAQIQEALGQGNAYFRPAIQTAGTGNGKLLFAPLGLIPDGASKGYVTLNNLNQPTPGFYVGDRSNITKITGRTLQIRADNRAGTWRGGPSSVMNPLPWEDLPSDAVSTPDYPALPATAYSLLLNGQNLSERAAALTPVTDLGITPSLIDLSLSVPKYQPANVNYGQVTFGRTFGSNYSDELGNLRGAVAGLTPMIGPVLESSGTPVSLNSALAEAAGGYISEMQVTADVTGGNGTNVPTSGNRRTIRQQAFTNRTSTGAAIIGNEAAYRVLTIGAGVSPSVRLRFQEATIDLGKVSHGAGYSDLINPNAPGTSPFRNPFTPFDVTTALDPVAPAQTYWSSQNLFRPFTLVSESNVNVVRPRIAKLTGLVNSTVDLPSLMPFPENGYARALQFRAEGVDSVAYPNLSALGFAGAGVGNIGVVSSLDHPSTNSGNYREVNVWQNILNAQVTGPGVANAGLSASDLMTGELGWTAGRQRQPTIHKPRPNDAAGQTMTLPDVPYNTLSTPTLSPQVSVAIPLGTPSGDYKVTLRAFEDVTPFQWRAWLQRPGSGAIALGQDYDGVLNTDADSGRPIEPTSDPSTTLKVTVVESRLTNNGGKGTIGQVDVLDAFRFDALNNPISGATANQNPTALTFYTPNMGGTAQSGLSLFWSSNSFLRNNAPTVNDSYRLMFSALPSAQTVRVTAGGQVAKLEDATPAVAGGNAGNATPEGRWWSTPVAFAGIGAVGSNGDLTALFPSTQAQANAVGAPFLSGVPALNTVRMASPAATQLETLGSPYFTEGVLFWQGQVMKSDRVSQDRASQTTDSRTFYTLMGVQNGAMVPVGNTFSFLNDPALIKTKPKPIYIRSGATNLCLLFWQGGNRQSTKIYYNANITDGLPANGWSDDTLVQTPASLNFISDPTPVYSRVLNLAGRDIIDLAYSGQLKNRRVNEILMSRFELLLPNAMAGRTKVELKPMEFPPVVREALIKVGGTQTYEGRDASWLRGPVPADPTRNYLIDVLVDTPRGIESLLPSDPNTGLPREGRFDEASGLLYFNSALGGQVIVDPRSGSVSFPNTPPAKGVRVYATYTPQTMRLNVGRDDVNLAFGGNGALAANDPSLASRNVASVSGNRTSPVMILDRSPNRRNVLGNPSVVRYPNGAPVPINALDTQIPSVARRWVLYKKSDVGPGAKPGLYYKTQRVMIQLPRPIRLTYPNGVANFNVTLGGLLGSGYEIDFIRNRIYFDEQMEGQSLIITYTTVNNGALTLQYIPRWGDEITDGASDLTSGFKRYNSAVERALPIDTTVNEGQITAIKDPFLEKLWVFWSSTRNGTADLFYQAIAPNLYPDSPVNQ